MKKLVGSHRYGKMALSSALVLALTLPVVASAQAASPTTPVQVNTTTYTYTITQDQLSKLASQFGFNLNNLFAGLGSNGSTGGSVVTKPSLPVQPSQPSQPSGTVKPSKPTTGNNGSTGSNNSGSTGGSTGSGSTGSGSTGSGSTGSNTSISDYAAQVVAIVNQERSKAGLSALTSDSKLTTVALAKAKDMYNNNYFDHNSPTYGSPFDMMKQFGVNYNYAGENIAKGQRSPTEVMTAWMNSSGHKANILGQNYKSIGVAYYNGEWVQEFTG